MRVSAAILSFTVALLLGGCAGSEGGAGRHVPPGAHEGPHGGAGHGGTTPGPVTPPALNPSAPPAVPTPGPPPVEVSGDRWSNPATWGGKVPAEGATVVIPAGRTILLDVDPPRLTGLTIEGTLVADDRDLVLKADWIMVMGGRFQIGTETRPFVKRATITLTGKGDNDANHGMGTRVLGVMDGVLDLHGAPVEKSWTRLNSEVTAGATRLQVADATGWKAGDRLVIATSSLNQLEHELVEVASVSGTTIEVKQPLKYAHFGAIRKVGDIPIDVRAEVGLLNRNIVIQGDVDSEATKVGAHMMFMAGKKATIRLSHIEVTRAGQLNRLGRYPVHFHLMANRCEGCFVRGVSVHDTIQRGVVVHDTTAVRIERNVVFNSVGHNFIVETTTTSGNLFDGNLAMVNRMPAPAITVPDLKAQNDDIPSGFWIRNGNNVFTNNHVGGSQGMGMWFDDSLGGPITLQRNTVHGAMTAGANRDFNMQSGILIRCGEEQPGTAQISDLLVYQNGGDGSKDPAGFWPEACTKYRKGFAPFEMKRIYAIDNVGKNIELRHQPDVYTISDAVVTGNLLGGAEKGTGVFAQYGGTVTLVRPTFGHYKTTNLLGSNDILGVWIARFRIQDARFVETDRARVARPNSLTEALDDSFLPKGTYIVRDGNKPTLLVDGCSPMAGMQEDFGVYRCPEPKLGFLRVEQGAKVIENESYVGGTPLHTVMPLVRSDGATFAVTSYGFGGYELWYGTGHEHALASQPAGTVLAQLDPMGSVIDGIDERAVLDLVIPFARAPRSVVRARPFEEGGVPTDGGTPMRTVNSRAELDASPLDTYWYDSARKQLRVKAMRRWVVIEP